MDNGGSGWLCGGPGRVLGFDKGFYTRPTVFSDVNSAMRIAQAVYRVVGDGDGFIHRLIRNDAQHRAEDFFLGNAHGVQGFEEYLETKAIIGFGE